MGQSNKHSITKLRCMNWNANGIRRQYNEFINFIAKNNIDLAVVTETHLKPIDKLNETRYTMYRLDRLHSAKGGLIILHKKTLHSVQVDMPVLESLETIGCHLFLDKSKLTIIGAYKQPSKIIQEKDIKNLRKINSKLIITGDLNCKNESWNSRKSNQNGNILFDILQRTDLIITAPLEPTFYPSGKGQPDVLDVVIFKNLQLSQRPTVANTLCSDHLPVLFVVDGGMKTFQPPSKNNVHTNWEDFQLSLQSTIIIPKRIDEDVDLENELLMFNEQIKMAYRSSSHFIESPIKHSDDSHLKLLIKIKNYVRKQYQKTRHPFFKTLLNNFNTKVHKRIQRNRIRSWSQFLIENDKPNNTFWRIAKQLKQKGNVQSQSPLKINKELVYENDKKVEVFANNLELQFSHHQLPTDDLFIYSINSKVRNRKVKSQLPESELLTPKDVWSIIKTLPNNKAVGEDGISNEQIKHLPRKAVVFLCRIFNKILQLGYFPKIWRHAYVVMIHKPGSDPQIPTNYRPISILSNLSKLCEKLILLKLTSFVEDNKILPSEQFGFRHGYGTDLQLMRIVDNITTQFTNKCSVLGLFLDAEKAYDRIWHSGLIYKLSKLNFPDYLINVIQTFLLGRTFQVKLNDSLSSIKGIRAGVPQGAVLSPLLFNIYISDIPKSAKTSLSLYADDIAIFSANKNVKYAYCELMRHIHLLETWLLTWRIKININKSCLIPFTWKRNINLPPIQFYNDMIQWTNSAKYLGVTLDKKLLLKDHITSVLHKATAKYMILYPLLKGPTLNIDTKKLLYTSIIRSGITYAGGVWKFAAKTHKKKLQILQNKILRTISGFGRDTKIVQIHEDLEISMLDQYLNTISKKLWSRIKSSDFNIINTIGSSEHRGITWRTPKDLN